MLLKWGKNNFFGEKTGGIKLLVLCKCYLCSHLFVFFTWILFYLGMESVRRDYKCVTTVFENIPTLFSFCDICKKKICDCMMYENYDVVKTLQLNFIFFF